MNIDDTAELLREPAAEPKAANTQSEPKTDGFVTEEGLQLFDELVKMHAPLTAFFQDKADILHDLDTQEGSADKEVLEKRKKGASSYLESKLRAAIHSVVEELSSKAQIATHEGRISEIKEKLADLGKGQAQPMASQDDDAFIQANWARAAETVAQRKKH